MFMSPLPSLKIVFPMVIQQEKQFNNEQHDSLKASMNIS